ncbi:MAG: hypothetical protein QG574_5236 [Cyanobacteriota bacterium erpe_2018_sw_21hr_WHONDRS-SW48-000092_B_bin.40]|jgi:sRNA-binding regulator protein Hfq|nr:hypothetical protein [Cyanobacteriota bacterium erpe_2018_sw_21hr_WHONDRS-SW48-000092_B_bin.40]
MTKLNELAEAEGAILINALTKGNAVYVLEINGKLVAQIGGQRFDGNDSQRLVYLHAVENLQKSKHLTRISKELYELTYPGWLQACAASSTEPEYGGGAIEMAKESLLLGALGQDNAIYLLPENSVLVVSTGTYSYSDSEEQRLLYIHALECLVEEEAAKFISGQLFELTYPGRLRAEVLIENVSQGKPNS